MSTDNTNKKDDVLEQIESATGEKETLNEEERAEEALNESASSSMPEEIEKKEEAGKVMSEAKQGNDGYSDDSFQELPVDSPDENIPEGEAENNKEYSDSEADKIKTETESEKDESKAEEPEDGTMKKEGKQEPEAQENKPEPDENLEEDGFTASDLPDEAAEESEGDENTLGIEPEQNPDEAMEEEAAAEEEEGEATEEDNKSAFKKFIMSSWKKVLRDCVIIILIVVFVYAFFYYHYGIGNLNNDSTANDETVVVETETETEKITEAPVETEPVQPETVIQYVEVEAEPVETENWKDTIFGEESSSLLKNITITGLTSVQKDRTGFRETDFLQALSDFLDANNITGITQVNFEEEIMCSSNGATAFRAALVGRPDKVLNVVLYPDYPGCYILTLQDAQEVTVEVQTQAQTESSSQNQTQSPSTYSTQQGSTTTEEQQQTAETSSTAETARAYDATTLSVIGIPDTLANYISNQYELQYTLYDYIYLNGYDADVAVVTDYYIDYDSRQAIIYFTLSDARMVTGTYSKDTNSYSYN